MHEAFARAAHSAPDQLIELHLELCGRPVRLRMVGRSLASGLARPFAHLRTQASPNSASLTIELWDESATGVGCPHRYTRDAFVATRRWGLGALGGEATDDVIGFHTAGALSMISRSARRVVGWVREFGSLTPYEVGKPLLPVLAPWFYDIGVLPLHAGMVARSGKGLLVGGAGGSGKTTVTLMCLKAGFDVLGDDWIAVGPKTPPIGHSLHGSTWLEPSHASRFPWLGDSAGPDPFDREKLCFLPSEAWPDRFVPAATLRGLVFPRVVAGRRTRLQRATPVEALRRLAPSSLFQQPFLPRAAAFQRMTELAEGLPAWSLELGSEMDEIPARVQDALDAVA